MANETHFGTLEMDRRSLIISLGLHISVIVLAWIGLPSIKRDLPEEQPIIVLEMVQSVPTTNLNKGDKPNTEKKEQKEIRSKKPPPPAPPRAKPPTAKPAVKSAKKESNAKAEILPQKVTLKPKPKPEIVKSLAPPSAKPKQTAKQEAPKRLPQSPPKRVNKLVQKKALQKQRTKALSGVMQNLAEAKIVSKDAKIKRREKERKEAAEKLTNSLTVAAGNALRAPQKPVVGPLGLSDIDRIRQHVSSCWSPPIGTAGADTLIVDIIVTLDKDGSVLLAEVDNKMRLGTDRTYRVAADEAIRTMFKCSPLPVPLDKYEQWKSFIFGFDPKFLRR
ncbi:cell envelope integrity protein TolA [Candidatus Puniceispirillum sp.]|nr:cell envelope integrity protein TolA [Candidatus Puniceispirillum sp.]